MARDNLEQKNCGQHKGVEVLAGGGENLLAREGKTKRIKTQARQINIHMGDPPKSIPQYFL